MTPDTIARGYCVGTTNGLFYEVHWTAPLRTINAAFSHAFGTRRVYVGETAIIDLDEISIIRGGYVRDNAGNDDPSKAELLAILEHCRQQYYQGNFEEVEL